MASLILPGQGILTYNGFCRLYAPAPPIDPKAVPGSTGEEQGEGTSILGLIPHQIRGYLGQFRNILVTGQQYDKCTGCSERVRAFTLSSLGLLLCGSCV